MDRRIVYTRPDGGVSICCPSDEVIALMSFGGAWASRQRGYVDIQIERQIKAGHRPDAARKFAHAVAFGGCSTSEAFAIIRDRDCGHLGTGHELWHVDDIPKDRWFRDAWVRSHNGGPINVNLTKARPIQFRRIKMAVDRENARRSSDLILFDKLVTVDWPRVRDEIERADDLAALRRVWPLN